MITALRHKQHKVFIRPQKSTIEIYTTSHKPGAKFSQEIIPESLFIKDDVTDEVEGIIEKMSMSGYVRTAELEDTYTTFPMDAKKLYHNITFHFEGFYLDEVKLELEEAIASSNIPYLKLVTVNSGLEVHGLEHPFALIDDMGTNVNWSKGESTFVVNMLSNTMEHAIILSLLAKHFECIVTDDKSKEMKQTIRNKKLFGFQLTDNEFSLAQSLGLQVYVKKSILSKHFNF